MIQKRVNTYERMEEEEKGQLECFVNRTVRVNHVCTRFLLMFSRAKSQVLKFYSTAYLSVPLYLPVVLKLLETVDSIHLKNLIKW